MKTFSKAETFASVEGERNFPIDCTAHRFRFTKRWFVRRNQTTWSTFLPRRFCATGPVNMIQIGVYEGMDLVWCLQHILGNSGSRVVAVDSWLGTTKIPQEQMDTVRSRAYHNLRPWNEQKLKIGNCTSKELLSQMLSDRSVVIAGKTICSGEWDLVVIDGDHSADAVYADACLSLQLVRPGGWLVFDDVRNRTRKRNHVADGLQRFVDEHSVDLRFEWAHRHCDCWSKW